MWLFPTEVANRWCCKRNSLVDTPVIFPPSMVNTGFESLHEASANEVIIKTKKDRFFIKLTRFFNWLEIVLFIINDGNVPFAKSYYWFQST